ncbi:MAG: hypothetical protein KAG96_00115 [Ichthyobacteriaceae bacterium]|nr:hypothetical protein [Ichthyobacteriaceae bacterium]
MKNYIKILGIISVISMFIMSCANELKEKVPVANWNVDVLTSDTNCKNIGKDYVGKYQLYIRFNNADSILITEIKSGITYKGYQSTEDSTKYTFKTSYMEDGGFLNENLFITRTSKKIAHGTGVWTWSDGLMHCEGEYKFLMKMIK